MDEKLVIFDCDGVLVDSERIANRVFAAQVVKLGLPMTEAEATARYTGIKMANAITEVGQILGRPLEDDFEATFRELSYEAFKKELEPVIGIDRVLSSLENPFCVASNGPRKKINLTLTLTGLLPYFDGRIFTAYDLDVWKPDPIFYLKVAAEMGFHPDDCMVVEDSRFGAIAGVRAGMMVFGYTGGDERTESDLAEVGAITFDSMHNLPRLLKQN